MIERERKVDVDKMSTDEINVLSIQIGNKMREICEEAASRANAILNIYGANCKIAIAFDKLPDKMADIVKSQKKRGRPRKNTNLNQESL